jgi:large subunit ribosomal protein L27
MSTKKAGGSSENGRDSIAKRLGVKRYAGQKVHAGEILVRQKGFCFRPGQNTYAAKDRTIHAGIEGVVAFRKRKIEKFNSRRELTTFVMIVPVKA